MLAQIRWHLCERTAQELANAFYRGLLSRILCEIMIHFGKIWNFAKFDIQWPLVTSILTWAKNRPKYFRNDFRRAFERAIRFPVRTSRCRVTGGGPNNPPPHQVVENREAPSGRGLSHHTFKRALYSTSLFLGFIKSFNGSPIAKSLDSSLFC